MAATGSVGKSWLKAKDALDLVAAKNNDPAPNVTIARRANAGMLAARADLFVFEQPRPRGEKEQVRMADADLPVAFWWAKGEAALEQDWPTGDFSTWIDQKFEWQAFGVQFERDGIYAMLAAERPVPDAASVPIQGQPLAEQTVLPSDEAIVARMIELGKRGWKRDAAAREIAKEPGFELVQVQHARRVSAGHFQRGRPKKTAS